jgi:hypothetical protein
MYQNSVVHVDAYDVMGQDEKHVLWSNTRDLGA